MMADEELARAFGELYCRLRREAAAELRADADRLTADALAKLQGVIASADARMRAALARRYSLGPPPVPPLN